MAIATRVTNPNAPTHHVTFNRAQLELLQHTFKPLKTQCDTPVERIKWTAAQQEVIEFVRSLCFADR